MACSEPRMTALKIAYKGELHRIRVDISSFSFEDLSALFSQTFALAPGSFVVQYNDPEGDVLNVTSQPEYVEACHIFLSNANEVKSLRFSAVTRAHVAFQENVAEPIVKAIEKLVETLKVAVEKVKQEQWAQRAHAGMEHTGDVLGRAAKDARESICAASKDAHETLCAASKEARESFTAASKEARESLSAAGKTIQEMPFDQMLKETTDGLKAAAEGISSFALELVDELKKIQIANTDAAAAVAVQPEPPVAPTHVQVQEPEWEQVEEAAPIEEAPVVVVAEPEVVEVVAPSADELKWATQLAVVRDIFPGVATELVIDRLEQCNGNVEVVVNALMEQV
ncbi:hypothetical protein ATCC90586_008289 [Pythium insidiosum]|nr:hypothetical protein ATCC90586_008289 [Pythium insidiosum]